MELKHKASSTGFRILFILDLLLKGPHSKNEILKALSKSLFLSNSPITKETIVLNINTLKNAGFEIENLGKSRNYRYKINWSPIKFKLTEEEMDVLTLTRDAVIELSNFEYILKLYMVFKKIAKFIEDKDQINKLLNFGYFLDVNLEILKELNAIAKRNKEVILLYNSPHSGKKEIQIKLKEIKYTNLKLYITGYCEEYPNETVLRIDNVIKILKILPDKEKQELKKQNKIICKIKPQAKNKVNFLDEEKILKEDKDFMVIELKAENTFFAVQKLLNLGDDLISIKDEKTKQEYLETLIKIKKLYEEKE